MYLGNIPKVHRLAIGRLSRGVRKVLESQIASFRQGIHRPLRRDSPQSSGLGEWICERRIFLSIQFDGIQQRQCVHELHRRFVRVNFDHEYRGTAANDGCPGGDPEQLRPDTTAMKKRTIDSALYDINWHRHRH